MKDTLSNFEPIQKFINGIGRDIKKYFNKDKGCIVYLLPDGIFYGKALYEWLNNKKNITITTMDDDGNGLEEEKIEGRKVLLVDNDIVTGKGYKRAMEAMRLRKKRLKIKDVKFAVFADRIGLADFSVEGYSAYAPWSLEKLDGIDLKIIQALAEDGRKSFVEIAKQTGLSQVAIKNRVERLIEEGVLRIAGLLNIEKFYNLSANIRIEADQKTILGLIEKLEKSPLAYYLAKTSGRYDLIVGIAAADMESIENFIAKEIKSDLKIKHIEVNVGELPIIPKDWNPPIS